MSHTIFSMLCQACGLSQREAGEYLQLRPDTVKSLASGRRTAPPGVIGTLAALQRQIITASDEGLAEIEHTLTQHGASAPTAEIELGLSSDDEEARQLGWPCVGAHAACLARTVAKGAARGWTFRIVPRGSTAATAGAADAVDAIHRAPRG